jgi:hypothetical protein
MLGGLIHFELLSLAEIVLFLVFVLLFVKGSIGFVGHRKEELMSKKITALRRGAAKNHAAR